MDWIVRAATWIDGAIWTAAPFVGFIILWLALILALASLALVIFTFWPIKTIGIPKNGAPLWLGFTNQHGTWRTTITHLIGLQSRHKTKWVFGLVLLKDDTKIEDH